MRRASSLRKPGLASYANVVSTEGVLSVKTLGGPAVRSVSPLSPTFPVLGQHTFVKRSGSRATESRYTPVITTFLARRAHSSVSGRQGGQGGR
jgi:hypothetical protein